jgi:hypothetical protein
MSDGITTFRFTHDHLGLPVPRVLHFDTTMENVINSAYMFQNRIPEQNPAKVFHMFNVEKSKSLMRQLIEINLDCRKSLTTPQAQSLPLSLQIRGERHNSTHSPSKLASAPPQKINTTSPPLHAQLSISF